MQIEQPPGRIRSVGANPFAGNAVDVNAVDFHVAQVGIISHSVHRRAHGAEPVPWCHGIRLGNHLLEPVDHFLVLSAGCTGTHRCTGTRVFIAPVIAGEIFTAQVACDGPNHSRRHTRQDQQHGNDAH